MASFIASQQLAERQSFELEVGPYLEKAWRRLSEQCNFEEVPAPPTAGEAGGAAGGSSGSGAKPDGAPLLEPGAGSSPRDSKQGPRDSLLQAPRMVIAILVVGTRGDVQPFLRLGQRLKLDGHRVRLATHDDYEGLVREGGLEFYPLGGDPKKLSSYMCQSNGRLMPNVLSKEERNQIPEKTGMLEEMMKNTWPAVSQPYPAEGPVFHADAVIANPVAYGHVHVAERLDIPVHLMFPQPWSPSGLLPHPLSILGRGCTSRDFRPSGLDASVRRAQNLSTYYAIDEFLYAGMRFMTNDFRVSIGLEKIKAGEDGAHILNTHEVPFAYQWSPLLLPRPEDYGPHLEVTGTIFNEVSGNYSPPPELEAWLEECRAENNLPIFVGFGSMMIEDPEELATTIVTAAKATGSRVLLQSSWSNFSLQDDPKGQKLVYILGNCPHEWLFRQVTAVVHHGGAGTAAAGIRAGVPTMICPFFGDQHIWAQAFLHQGLAVEPVPIQELTADILAQRFRTLRGLDEEGRNMRQRCSQVGHHLQEEDGVAGALECFYRHLPLEGLVCDASLMLGPERDVKMARWWSPHLGLKLCPEALAALRKELPEEIFKRCEFVRYHYSMAWGFANPRSFVRGLTQACRHLLGRYAQAGLGLVVEPVKGVVEGWKEGGLIGAVPGGVVGAARGIQHGLHHLQSSTRRVFVRPLKALRSESGRGGRQVHPEEVGYHEYHADLEPAEARQLLKAVKSALALHESWRILLGDQTEDRPGHHGTVSLQSVANMLQGMNYSEEAIQGVAVQLGNTSDSDESENERHQRRVRCFTGEHVSVPRRAGSSTAKMSSSDKPMSFEEVAVLLQPYGLAPRFEHMGLEYLVRQILGVP